MAAVLLFLATMMMRLLAAAVFTVLPVESSAANATGGLKVRREDMRVGFKPRAFKGLMEMILQWLDDV